MPLTDKQMQSLKEELLTLKKNLEGEEGFEEDYTETTGELSSGVDNHMADQAAEYEDRMKEQTFQRADQEKLQEVDEALERMEEGTYGVCVDTGEEIPYERLEIVPYTKRTIEAQQKVDQEGSDQMADQQFAEAMDNVADRDTLREETLTTTKLDKEQDAYR